MPVEVPVDFSFHVAILILKWAACIDRNRNAECNMHMKKLRSGISELASYNVSDLVNRLGTTGISAAPAGRFMAMAMAMATAAMLMALRAEPSLGMARACDGRMGALARGAMGMRMAMRAELPVNVRPSPGKGMGAFAMGAIPQGTYVTSYRGEYLTPAQVTERFQDLAKSEYLFALGDVVIDASESDHASRFFNHEEHGSLMAAPAAEDDSQLRIDFYSTREIASGEELTFDYGVEYWAARDAGPTADSDSRLAEIRRRRALRWAVPLLQWILYNSVFLLLLQEAVSRTLPWS